MRALVVLALLALPACQREPTFEERYDAAAKAVATSGAALEGELRAREQWRAAEEAAAAQASGAASAAPTPDNR